MERNSMLSRFKLNVARDLPKPLVRGYLSENVVGSLSVHEDRKLPGRIESQPVAVAYPNAIFATLGNVYFYGSVLNGNTGLVSGYKISASHKVNELSILFPTALVVKIKSVYPNSIFHFCYFPFIT